MSWLVTGGAGYIGAHVVRSLADAGLGAVVVDDLSSGHREFVPAGVPFVEGTITDTDLLVLPPSNPVVSVGTILGVPGIRDAVRATAAPVVGLSPVVAGDHVRGMAAQLLRALDVEVTAAGVAGHYGARSRGGVIDGWLVAYSRARVRMSSAGMPVCSDAHSGVYRATRSASSS